MILRSKRAVTYNLLIAVGLAVGWYIVLAAILYTTIRPTADMSLFFPSLRDHVKPELDLLLYALGLCLIPITSIILYYGINSAKNRHTPPFFRQILYLSCQCIALYLCAEYFLIISFTASELVTMTGVLSSITTIVVTCLFFLPSSRKEIYKKISHYLDLFLLLVLFSLIIGGIYLLFFSSWFASTSAITIIRSHGYPAFSGFSSVTALMMFTVILGIIALRRRYATSTLRPQLLHYIIDAGAIIGIIVLVSSVIPTNSSTAAVDYMPMMGPVHDVLRGKTLLVNAPSTYGLLLIYALAGIFTWIPLSTASFFFIHYVTVILGCISLYGLLSIWLKSRFFAIIGMILLFLHFYFPHDDPLLFFSQTAFLRFGMWMPIFAILIYRSQIIRAHRLWNYLEYIFLGIAAFWGFDVGLYVIGAYVVAKIGESIHHSSTVSEGVQRGMRSLLQIGMVLLLSFLLISLFSLVRSRSVPNWYSFFASTTYYARGWDLLPLSKIDTWHIVLLGYLFGMGYLLTHLLVKRSSKSKELPVIAFLITYGSLQFLYYTGRSTQSYLHLVSIPFLLLCTWALSRLEIYLQDCPWRQWSFPLRLQIYSASIVLILVLTVIHTIGGVQMIETIRTKNRTTRSAAARIPAPETPSFHQSVTTIQSLLPAAAEPNGDIALLSDFDGEVLIAIGRANVIDSNYLPYHVLRTDISRLGEQLLARHPRVVFVDHEPSERISLLLSSVQQQYELTRTIGYFDIWEQKPDISHP